MNETIKRMNNLFNNEQMSKKLLTNMAGKYEKVFRDMLVDIRLIEKEGFKTTDINIEDVKYICDVIKHRVLVERNSKDSLSFFKDFVLIVFNWNNNTVRDSKLKVDTDSIFNFIDGQFTMRDTIEIMKNMNARMIDLQNWNPPAFKISQSLFDSLK